MVPSRQVFLLLAVCLLAASPRSLLAANNTLFTEDLDFEAPTIGPKDALVTIEIYGDLSDSRTEGFHEAALAIHRQHPQRVRIIYRLTSYAGTWKPTIETAFEAFRQHHFFQYAEKIYASNAAPGLLEAESVFTALDLDLGGLHEAITSQKSRVIAEGNFSLARRRNVRSIPGLTINGQAYGRRILRNPKELELAFQRAQKRARQLLDRGIQRQTLYPEILRWGLAARSLPRLRTGRVNRVTTFSAAQRRAKASSPTDALSTSQEIARAAKFGASPTYSYGFPPIKGKVSPVIHIDFFCHFLSRNCASVFKDLKSIQKAFPTEVEIAFVPWADKYLEGHKAVVEVHAMSVCLAEIGKFWDFVNFQFGRLYQRQFTQSALTSGALASQIAKILGIPPKTLQRCARSTKHRQAVKDAFRKGAKAGVRVAPMLLIAGKQYFGTQSQADLLKLINYHLGPGVFEQLAPRQEFLK